MGKLWHKDQQSGWTEMECMIRDWVNWTWLSGDHIVEQHVHNIDVSNWFVGELPRRSSGNGIQAEETYRVIAMIISVLILYTIKQVHMNSMCRQINDCANSVSEHIRGTKGYTDCGDRIPSGILTAMSLYEYTSPEDADGESHGQ